MNDKEQYQAEQTRLIESLGKLTEGGIVESMQHIGATSLPGLSASPCVDIALSIWPFPLLEGAVSKLDALGYQILEGYTAAPQQRFCHRSGCFQLFCVESGSEDWLDLVLVNEYLQYNEEARAEISTRKANFSVDKSALFSGLLPEAQQWWVGHYGFSPVEAVAGEMRNASFEWYVSGGWALDLFLDRVERVHHDVDLVIPRQYQLELQKYLTERGWTLLTPFEKRLEPWPPYMRLELPRHQVHAFRDEQFIDLLLTDTQDVWRYRREPLVLRSKEKMSLVSKSGIPYLAPELVLLFKSKNTSNRERSKDQPDIEKTLPHFEPERRAWLYWALMATNPDHAWIKHLVS